MPTKKNKPLVIVNGEDRCAGTQISTPSAVLRALRASARAAVAVHGASMPNELRPGTSGLAVKSWGRNPREHGGTVLRALNRDEEALEEFQNKARLLDKPLASLAMTYAKMGRRTEAMQVIRALDAREDAVG